MQGRGPHLSTREALGFQVLREAAQLGDAAVDEQSLLVCDRHQLTLLTLAVAALHRLPGPSPPAHASQATRQVAPEPARADCHPGQAATFCSQRGSVAPLHVKVRDERGQELAWGQP